jgi:hypothetical protein
VINLWRWRAQGGDAITAEMNPDLVIDALGKDVFEGDRVHGEEGGRERGI